MDVCTFAVSYTKRMNIEAVGGIVCILLWNEIRYVWMLVCLVASVCCAINSNTFAVRSTI